MFKLPILILLLALQIEAAPLKSLISNMIIIGFEGTTLPKELAGYIQKNGIGGVILFAKNIKSPKQLQTLTKTLRSCDPSIMIALDQEGGLVERLNKKNGFISTDKPAQMAQKSTKEAADAYEKMAKLLYDNGINVNFAPSVDLAKNPKNTVIVKYGRSFSKDPQTVIKYASVFMHAMQKYKVLSVIKHFPGHGSSLDDSHQGFVDVSDTWGKDELIPFFALQPKAIMSAHIYNRHLDAHYPASLSKKTLSCLRDKGYEGLLISDDMQMRAISQNYDLNTTLAQAINASTDMLLFGNQLSKPTKITTLVDHIQMLVEQGKIKKAQIIKANKRINRIKKELQHER